VPPPNMCLRGKGKGQGGVRDKASHLRVRACL
jgi:hypothetical protein